MEDGKMTFKDVCNIMMPMLGYYGVFKEKGINLVNSDVGLSLLNYKFSLQFQDNYEKAKDCFVNYYLQEALDSYLDDTRTKEVFDEETNEYEKVYVNSHKKCVAEINEYKEIYGDKVISEVRTHVREKTRKKELVLKEGKTLANYL